MIGGEPGRERAFRVIELLAAGSIERLWITDAYLVAPPRLFQALRDAARDGVDVRLLVPGSSDLPLVRNLSRIGYRELLRSGVRIYEWDGPMLHAKTIVADGRWVRVGSSNLNPSSLIGNYELDVLIEDPALAEAMERQFRLDIARSREVRRRPLRGPRRISEALPTALTREDPSVRPASLPAPAARDAAGVPRWPCGPSPRNARRSVFLPFGRHLRVARPALLRPAARRRRTSSASSVPGWRSAPGGRRSGGGRIGEADRRTRLATCHPASEIPRFARDDTQVRPGGAGVRLSAFPPHHRDAPSRMSIPCGAAIPGRRK